MRLFIWEELKLNWQAFQTVQDKGRHRLQFYLAIPSNAGKAFEHDAQRNLRLKASEGRAEAEVDAVAEGQVPVRRAVYIKRLGVGKLRLVTVG